jgi:hypothetical protein
MLLLLQGAQKPPVASGVITGRILAPDGTPASGVRVSAVSVDNAVTGAGNVMMAGLAQTDDSGRFRLEELPSGRYYIVAGPSGIASYFPGVRAETDAQPVTVPAGAKIAGVNFSLARSVGVRVSGRVFGAPMGIPAGMIRVTLLPQGQPGGSQIDAPVQEDGTFAFTRVVPGRYVARVLPAVAPVSNLQLQLDDQDASIELNMAAILVGHVVMDDGSKLPVQRASVPQAAAILLAAGAAAPLATVNNNDPTSMIQIRGQRSAGPVAPAAGGGRGAAGVAQFTQPVRADGYFIAPVGPGEYQISAAVLPFGYYIKTVAMDRIKSQLQITMTTQPPNVEPPGVKVSGRITGASGSGARWVRMQSVVTAPFSPGVGTSSRIGEAPIRDDGTFEVLRVSPGPVTLQIMSASASDIVLQMKLDIADQDVAIDLAVTPPRPNAGLPAPGVASPAPAPFTVTIP